MTVSPDHRHQLAGDDLVTRGELDAEDRQHVSERLVRERQRLSVTLHPLDGHTDLLGPPPPDLE